MSSDSMFMDRRKFIGSVASIAGLGVAQSCWAGSAVAQNDFTDFDWIIVGGGVAGLTAACIASELGFKRIVLLESEPVLGGSSIVSGGLWAVAGTQLQQTLGIYDDSQAFEKDILRVGHYANRLELVEAFIRYNKIQYDWVREVLGVAPKGIVTGAGVRRAHAFDAQSIVFALYRRAVASGVTILTSTRAMNLTVNSTGSVSGCIATRTGKEISLSSKNGVLLATGGFSRNRELLMRFSPRMRFVKTIAAQGCRGDGLLMGQRLGAGLADMQFLEASYAFVRNPSTVADMTLLPYYGAIVVNSGSKRFIDEALPYKQIAQAVLDQEGGASWIVFDDNICQVAQKQAFEAHLWKMLRDNRVPTYVCRENTLEKVAISAGLDPVELVKTVDAYNQTIQSQHLPRGLTSVGDGTLPMIDKPPFYVMPASVALLGTYCGLAINQNANVVTEDGTIIEGLYAAGEVTGGFHGASFIMGTAFGKAMTFGRIAAMTVAQKAKEGAL